ncbi:MAG: hypothetical protein N3G75_06225, partial [Methanothrix sp.]
ELLLNASGLCNMSKELILDIETIPADQEALDRYCSLFPNKKKPRESPGLHPCTARIIAVGLKLLGDEPVVFINTEREVLESTKLYIESVRPTRFITFNGTSFDFPMLRLRAAALGVRGLGRLLPASRSPPELRSLPFLQMGHASHTLRALDAGSRSTQGALRCGYR